MKRELCLFWVGRAIHLYCILSCTGRRPLKASSGHAQGLDVVKWPYCHQVVWSFSFFLTYFLSVFFFFYTQKGAVSRLMGKNRMEGGRRMSQSPWYRAVKGPSRLGLTCVYNPER